MLFTVRFLPGDTMVIVPGGTTVLEAAQLAGCVIDAPCGGNHTCGKCRVRIGDSEVSACDTVVGRNLTVEVLPTLGHTILIQGAAGNTAFMVGDGYALAFDIGTTTVVGFLLDLSNGETLAVSSALNPQTVYGADLISRLSHATEHGAEGLRTAIHATLNAMTEELAAHANISPTDIKRAVIAGNTCMHHLLFGLPIYTLAVAPYAPSVTGALELPAKGLLSIADDGVIKALPVIAGFVGADTAAVMLSVCIDRLREPTLIADIGTNGELMLTDGNRIVVCSTAAGPAFEGSGIACGMRGADGAIDHVYRQDGLLRWSVVGGGEAVGICGSGLVDLVALLVQDGTITDDGRLVGGDFHLTDRVFLTQKDVREVQLAKAAIAAGIGLMCEHLDLSVADIKSTLLAGAFGNCLNPDSARAIGLLPPTLLNVTSIGNAAGEGARRAALSDDEWRRCADIAARAEFLDLASKPEFQNRFVDQLTFDDQR